MIELKQIFQWRLWVGLAVLIGACDLEDDDGPTISGAVRLGDTGLADVVLTLEAQGRDETRSTRTDADGDYGFTGDLSGAYTLTAQKVGYVFLPEVIALDPEHQVMCHLYDQE